MYSAITITTITPLTLSAMPKLLRQSATQKIRQLKRMPLFSTESKISNISSPMQKNMTNAPVFIDRDQKWVKKVMNAVHKTPFSRVKSLLRILRKKKPAQRVISRVSRRKTKYSAFLRERLPLRPFIRSRNLTETT